MTRTDLVNIFLAIHIISIIVNIIIGENAKKLSKDKKPQNMGLSLAYIWFERLITLSVAVYAINAGYVGGPSYCMVPVFGFFAVYDGVRNYHRTNKYIQVKDYYKQVKSMQDQIDRMNKEN